MARRQTPASDRLPVTGLVRQAYRYLLAEQRRLIRLALGWLLLAYALGLLLSRLPGVPSPRAWAIANLVDFLGYSAVGVAWLRHLVLGEAWPNRTAPLRGPVFAYIFWGFLAMLLAVVPALLASSVAGGLLALLFARTSAQAHLLIGDTVMGAALLASYLFTRLMFVPLARALGEPVRFVESLALSRGNGLCLLLGSFLVVLPLLLAIFASLLLLGGAGASGDVPGLPSQGAPLRPSGLLLDLVLRSVQYAEAALTATFAAGSYAFLLGRRGGPPVSGGEHP